MSINVTMDLPTALGLANNPATLSGYGPIPGPLARMLATDAGWHRMVHDPITGYLLDYGTTTYTPPQILRDYLTARDPICCFPGCHQPGIYAEADHTNPYPNGPTAAHNCRMVCKRHHQNKTNHRWTYTSNPDNTTTWHTPNGHTYTHPNDP